VQNTGALFCNNTDAKIELLNTKNMVVEFIVDQDYGVEGSQVSGMELLKLIKIRSSSNFIMQQLIKDGRSSLEARSAVFPFVTYRESGESEQIEIVVNEGLNSISEETIKKYEHLLGYINYPISREAEEYLAQTTEEAVERGSHSTILIEFILGSGIRGDVSSELRTREKGVYFELTEPLRIAYKEEVVDTNDIFDLLFGLDDGYISGMHLFATIGLGGNV
jgi:hypothetical protein